MLHAKEKLPTNVLKVHKKALKIYHRFLFVKL